MRIIVLTLLTLAAPLAAAQPAFQSGFVTTSDGVRIHYLESGKGPAMVLVPGWTMPAEIWEPQIRYFSRQYRVVAMDPRSQGESDKPAEGHYPERRAQDVKELVDQLKLAPAVLVGWSMGVPEVLSYAEQFGTATIRALILVDGTIGSDPNPQLIAGFTKFLKAMQLDRRRFADQFVRSMYRKPQPEEYLKKIIAASLQTPTNTAVTLGSNMFTGDWRPVLAKLDKPVLSAIASPRLKAEGEVLKAKVPSAQVEFFAEAGHALFVDEPERFNKLLEKFLSRE